MTHKIEPQKMMAHLRGLPKGKGKLIDPEKFEKISQALAPSKITPLDIEDYMYINSIGNFKELYYLSAIRALFAKVNEVIYKLEEREK